jgi:hypothetical protein
MEREATPDCATTRFEERAAELRASAGRGGREGAGGGGGAACAGGGASAGAGGGTAGAGGPAVGVLGGDNGALAAMGGGGTSRATSTGAGATPGCWWGRSATKRMRAQLRAAAVIGSGPNQAGAARLHLRQKGMGAGCGSSSGGIACWARNNTSRQAAQVLRCASDCRRSTGVSAPSAKAVSWSGSRWVPGWSGSIMRLSDLSSLPFRRTGELAKLAAACAS